MGLDWNYRQQSYYTANAPSRSGHQWSRDLILFFWDEAYNLWQLRNEAIHDPETEPRRQDYVQRVEELYAQEPNVLAQDRDIFHIPLADLLTQSIHHLHNFIQSFGPVIAHSVQENNRRLVATNHSILNYLSPRP